MCVRARRRKKGGGREEENRGGLLLFLLLRVELRWPPRLAGGGWRQPHGHSAHKEGIALKRGMDRTSGWAKGEKGRRRWTDRKGETYIRRDHEPLLLLLLLWGRMHPFAGPVVVAGKDGQAEEGSAFLLPLRKAISSQTDVDENK